MTNLDEYIEKDNDATWLTTKVVAERFRVTRTTIFNHKEKHSELIAGIDYIYNSFETGGQNRKVLLWSKQGITKLSQIIRTDEAKEHRDKTLVPIETIYKALMDIQPHLAKIPIHEDRLDNLEDNLVSPITMSKLRKISGDLRKELADLGVKWCDIHSLNKGWTGLASYEHMNRDQLEEGIRRLKGAIDTKKDTSYS